MFKFPNPVNEVSARLVAGGVVLMTSAYVITGWSWVLFVLAYGFVARALTGPTLSPLGQLVTRVITPALPIEPRPTAGPPKRFAQAIGAMLSVSAVGLYLGGSVGGSKLLVAMVLVAASLEAFLGFCLGCRIFAVLMRRGVIPERVCEDCNDLSRRIPDPSADVDVLSAAR